MRILIVDDDDVSLDMLRDALEHEGHDVVVATDGEAALDVIDHEEIRFVITDWEMPRLNGLDLCRAIRRQESKGYVFVVLLTSHDDAAEIVEGLSAGADDFICKPFRRAELMARVRTGERVLALDTHEMVIFALAKLAESRDTDTGLHLERVQRYCRTLAESLVENPRYQGQIDSEFVRLVYQTSPLHDIGKVGVPDAVLLKPGKLTKEEFEVMKKHVDLGAETLEAALHRYPNARFLQVARDIALYHHERWDGRGYPRGLAGEQIPLAARILSLADVYDALTSKRAYKEAFSHEVSRDILIKDSGKHFDPGIVDAFLRVEEEFIRIREQFTEPTYAPTHLEIFAGML